ncbi:MAG: hypothetical protein KKD77_22845 [Gammaproteobacteria bacterium]|nr:hypothetical protein [Gammaproteobacteria bacterium]
MDDRENKVLNIKEKWVVDLVVEEGSNWRKAVERVYNTNYPNQMAQNIKNRPHVVKYYQSRMRDVFEMAGLNEVWMVSKLIQILEAKKIIVINKKTGDVREVDDFATQLSAFRLWAEIMGIVGRNVQIEPEKPPEREFQDGEVVGDEVIEHSRAEAMRQRDKIARQDGYCATSDRDDRAKNSRQAG